MLQPILRKNGEPKCQPVPNSLFSHPTGALLSIMCTKAEGDAKTWVQVFLFLGPRHILQQALMSITCMYIGFLVFS